MYSTYTRDPNLQLAEMACFKFMPLANYMARLSSRPTPSGAAAGVS